jgi:hypothetical protein
MNCSGHELLRVLGAQDLHVLGHALVALFVPLGDGGQLFFAGCAGHLCRPDSPAFVVRRHDIDVRHSTRLDHLAFQNRHQGPAHGLAFDHDPVVCGDTSERMVEQEPRPRFKVFCVDHCFSSRRDRSAGHCSRSSPNRLLKILPPRHETRYTRLMSLRFDLDESVAEEPIVATVVGEIPPPSMRQLLDADWEDSKDEPLMLYVAEEPRVGLEFSYHGLSWQIVDYREGWIARLLVD